LNLEKKFNLISSIPYQLKLKKENLPQAVAFAGAQLNFRL